MTLSLPRRAYAACCPSLIAISLVTAVATARAGEPGPARDADPAFRGVWVNAFDEGLKSRGQIDDLVGRTATGRYNAIVAEVLAYQDDEGNGHGAYWHSDIIPWAAETDADFDPLAYLVEQAHAVGVEVHCWLVPFRVCEVWPPSGNSLLAGHAEWLTVTDDYMDQGPVPVSGYYLLDPGSPDVQDYLMSIVVELCTDYEIDGIHWDYIRYTNRNAGYPTTMEYEGSTLRRYQRITGSSDVPSTIDEDWSDFRRRTVTEVVRRARFEIPRITENPRQPLRHTAALITSYPAASDFTETRPYRELFCNWEYWARMGYLDATIPMAYFAEYHAPDTYRAWVDHSVGWAYDRHTYIGVGTFVNYSDDSVTQIEYAFDHGAHGVCTYSYTGTGYDFSDYADWYPYIAQHSFSEPAPMPVMPWRDPATAVEGTLWGQITDYSTGAPIDDAEVRVGGMDVVRTDGNGYYTATLIPAAGAGRAYDVEVTAAGYDLRRAINVLVVPGDIRQRNVMLGGPSLPGDMDVDGDVDFDDLDGFTFCCVGPEFSFPAGHFCVAGDSDGDRDVDLADVAAFQHSFTGSP